MSTAAVAVLVVAADPSERDDIRRALEDELVEVVAVPSGLHALQVLQARPVDIVVSEANAPGLEAVRLLEIVRERWPESLRVLLTSQPDLAVFVDCVNRGNVHKILVQSTEPASYREAIEELVNECLARRRPT